MSDTADAGEPLEILLLPDRRGYRLLAPRFLAVPETRVGPEEGAAGENSEREQPGTLRRAAGSVAAGYRRLTHKRSVREDLLRELREDAGLIVKYPAGLAAGEARDAFRRLLAAHRRKHRRWMIANGAMLPLGAVLTLIPGPNVFAAYLAWRTLAHHRAGRGSRAGLASTDVRFEPDPTLEELATVRRPRFLPGRRRKTRLLGKRLGIVDLDRVY